MSDATPPPAPTPAADSDPDAWAAACEEDLAAEQARRRERYGTPPGDPAAELRGLADAVTERLGRLGAGLGMDVTLLTGQARAALDPVLERNAEVLRHLTNAGQELAAAYRAAVLGHEQRWTRAGDTEHRAGKSERPGRPVPEEERRGEQGREAGGEGGRGDGPGDDGGTGNAQRIDLD